MSVAQQGRKFADAEAFRTALSFMEAGDVGSLRELLRAHPELTTEREESLTEGYFQTPTLLRYVAENPIRTGKLPPGIVEVALVLLDGGASDVTETLMLVSSGCVPRECGVQVALIDLLCDHGADPNYAICPAVVHSEFQAVERLLERGARLDLTVAAGTGRRQDFDRLLPDADPEQRHRALAVAAQFGYDDIVRVLLNAGEDPNRFNPPGFHGHSTPLHQAVCFRHVRTAKLLFDRGARLDTKDKVWGGTPLDWARHGGHKDMELLLQSFWLQSF